MNLIESTTLTFLTGGAYNTGEFWGFTSSTPISYFTLSNAYIGIVDLTVQPVPEPATLLLLGAGLGAVAARRRLKKRA